MLDSKKVRFFQVSLDKLQKTAIIKLVKGVADKNLFLVYAASIRLQISAIRFISSKLCLARMAYVENGKTFTE